MNSLAGIPSHAYYRLNTGTLANPQDSRGLGTMIQRGAGTRRRRRHRRHVQKSKVVKNKNKHKNKNAGSRSRRRHKRTKTPSYVNYAGRQIGHQSQRQSQRQSQSGGFQSDANLIVSSLGNLVNSGISTLRGTDPGDSAIPFSDKPYQRNL